MGRTWLPLFIAPLVVVGCQTLPDDAVELKNAETAVDVAEDRDVDDLLPSVMELAHLQLDESKDLWEQADERSEESRAEAETLREESRMQARSAESLALSGIAIKERLEAWNDDPRQFVRMRDLANASDGLSQRIATLEAEDVDQEDQPATALTGQDLLQGIPIAFFETNQAELTGAAQDRVDQLVSFMKNNQETIITLAGFADPRGEESYNAELSKRRGEAVAKLLKDAGIEDQRVKVTGEGEAESGAEETDLAGLQLDRRVEAFIEQGTAH